MNKKFAMSAIGYAISIVIVLALVMIFSAPMLVENVKEDNQKSSKQLTSYNYSEDNYELKRIEEQLSLRISKLENSQSNSNVKNKYICTIEGKLDENGNVVSVNSDTTSEKFVFVCEYRQ